ncbi:MAG: transposase [Planctomycetaceae bacterium]
MFNLPPPPGFQGLRDDLPRTVYRRTLPHWRQDGATYFVTFRLHDSLPQSKLRELREFKREWHRRRSASHSDDALARETMRRVERWLDKGMGSCMLRSADVSARVAEVLVEHDGADCELGCFVVMPNHVHAVLRPLTPAELPLEAVLKRIKGASACEVNALLSRSGTFWQHETFDRIVRDAEHLWRVIQYIGRNPELAGLRSGEYRLWIRPSWQECGWQFESALP